MMTSSERLRIPAFFVLLASACGGPGTDTPGGSDVVDGSGGVLSGVGGSLTSGGALGSGSGSSLSSGGALSTGGTGGLANTGGAVNVECTNVRPTGTEWDAATCADWASATSECSAAWMIDNNYCNESCGRCSAAGTGGDTSTGGASTGGGAGTGGATTGGSGSTSEVQVFILFGQSNMWGVPQAAQQDLTVDQDVEVMALTSCAGQTIDSWYPATPPLHGCLGKGTGNPGLGPGDYFAKTLAAAYPNDKILLVPNAIPGVSIDVFAKGQSAYTSMVARAKKAQQRGTIRGIIFHQGETDTGSSTWISRVKTVVENLRTDLGIGNVPFLAGELPYTGCCGSGHNPLIAKLPANITNAHVVSASGLTIMADNLHFDTASQREFGKRYGNVMLPLLTP